MSRQTTSHLLMIRPVQFAFNKQTSGNNAFQSVADPDAQDLALKEFDDFVKLLRHHGIDVTVVDDTHEPHTPDSIFPNNWISFHDDGQLVLYPMFAVNRRQERKPHVIEQLKKKFKIGRQLDLSVHENDNRFLEGTGSMVLDRAHKIAYACLSERTSKHVLDQFCDSLGYRAVAFNASDETGFPIYHTNVMMCIADSYAVVCLDSIADTKEREKVMEEIQRSKKAIIPISIDQMNRFAGNMLQVHNASGKKFLIMSSKAFSALTPDQITDIGQFDAILHSSLDTIERNGGGSARCMMAEVFLPTIA